MKGCRRALLTSTDRRELKAVLLSKMEFTVFSLFQEALISARTSKHRIGRSANIHVQLMYNHAVGEKHTHSEILSKFEQHPPLSTIVVRIAWAHLAPTLYSIDNILSRGSRANLYDRRPLHITEENPLLPGFFRSLPRKHIVRRDGGNGWQSSSLFAPMGLGIDRNFYGGTSHRGLSWGPIIFILGPCLALLLGRSRPLKGKIGEGGGLVGGRITCPGSTYRPRGGNTSIPRPWTRYLSVGIWL